MGNRNVMGKNVMRNRIENAVGELGNRVHEGFQRITNCTVKPIQLKSDIWNLEIVNSSQIYIMINVLCV